MIISNLLKIKINSSLPNFVKKITFSLAIIENEWYIIDVISSICIEWSELEIFGGSYKWNHFK